MLHLVANIGTDDCMRSSHDHLGANLVAHLRGCVASTLISALVVLRSSPSSHRAPGTPGGVDPSLVEANMRSTLAHS